MYTVLVVDDEELICLGIKSMIERLKHPEISAVLLAANAAQAEDTIRGSSPEIVITDIQMPGTNGLEMIKTLTRVSPGIKFIVLSGYDEFQYAREALKLGVMDYLLKPASILELKNVLDSAVSALNMERQNSSQEQELRYRQLFLENSLRKLFLYKSLDEFDVINIFDRIRQLFPYTDFTVGLISLDGMAGAGVPGSNTGANIAGEGLSAAGDGWQTAGFMNDSGHNVIVVNHSHSLQHGIILPIFMDIAAAAKDRWGCSPTAALSASGVGIESLILLYRQAEKALSYRLVMGGTEVIEFEGIKDRPADTAHADWNLRELNEFLKLRKEEQVSSLIDTLLSQQDLANRSIDYVSRLFSGISRQLGGLAATDLQLSMEESVKPFESFATLQNMRIYLKERVHQIVMALKEEDTGKKVMASAMTYMRENMAEKISLAAAASRAGVSYTHFSRLFKKRTGMNFSEYLMKVRMEEAKRLLDDPTFKVYEVAAKVGYNDPKHFSRAFRLYYDISPLEYRSDASDSDLPENR
jgi:two-component system, response regulator YesN